MVRTVFTAIGGGVNNAELAWVAGYLEGEGCFHLMKCRKERFGLYHYPRVVCACTDLDVLQRLQQFSGVGRITGPTQRGTHSPVWQWTVSKSREAVGLMEAIHPQMGQRRQAKIDEVLDFVSRSKSLRLVDRPRDQRAWVTGFLEAEGAFFWMTFQKGKYGPYYYPRVGAGGTDQDVIARLPQYTGVGQVTGPYSKESPRKAVWYWTVTSRRDAVALMEAIYPFMGERRRAKIDEVLSFVEQQRQPRPPQPRVIRLEPNGPRATAPLDTTTKGRV